MDKASFRMSEMTQARIWHGCILMTLGCVLGFSTMGHACQDLEKPEPRPNRECKNPTLRRDLLRRMEVDQEARFAQVEELWQKPSEPGLAPQPSETTLQKLRKIDEDNRIWLQRVVEKQGWPGHDWVGEDRAHATWLLVQHADADPNFQARRSALMKECPVDQVAQVDIAYPDDRTRIARGKPQLDGTQVEFKEGQWKVKPVVDRGRLDELRATVGLPAICEYLELVWKMQAGEIQNNETKEQAP
jgi:hypothetical protein